MYILRTHVHVQVLQYAVPLVFVYSLSQLHSHMQITWLPATLHNWFLGGGTIETPAVCEINGRHVANGDSLYL